MLQAKNHVCRACWSGVPSGHKFCGRCGGPVPPEVLSPQTPYYGDMQNPAKAKLILIRGDGMEGLAFHLKSEQHIVGRNGQLAFGDDPYVSPRHANFFYRDDKLVVRDEGSLNGVYARVRGTVEIVSGDTFLVGDQILRLETVTRSADAPDADGTLFYGSPRPKNSAFRVVQLLAGGAPGMTVYARGSVLDIGREGADLCFQNDTFLSPIQCRIEERDRRIAITDLDSKNGVYVRLKGERVLGHGDYVFVGRKLFRVEMNSN